MHDHGHHHHHHGDTADEAVRRALSWALVLNGAFLVVELAVGWVTGSLALLSDAAHMVGDVGAVGLALGAAHLARRRATAQGSFGFRRAEVLGAFVNGLLLVVACGWIFWSALARLRGEPPHVEAAPVLWVGLGGLAINLGSAWFLHRADHGNLNVRGALLHMLADALGSVGAVVTAVLLSRGIYAADAVVSLLIGALVLTSSWSLLRDSTRILLQFAPRGLRVEEVRQALLEVEGVLDVHDLHIWTLDGQNAILSTHLVGEDTQVPEPLRGRAESMLAQRFHIDHSTIQSETVEQCTHPGCALHL